MGGILPKAFAQRRGGSAGRGWCPRGLISLKGLLSDGGEVRGNSQRCAAAMVILMPSQRRGDGIWQGRRFAERMLGWQERAPSGLGGADVQIAGEAGEATLPASQHQMQTPLLLASPLLLHPPRLLACSPREPSSLDHASKPGNAPDVPSILPILPPASNPGTRELISQQGYWVHLIAHPAISPPAPAAMMATKPQQPRHRAGADGKRVHPKPNCCELIRPRPPSPFHPYLRIAASPGLPG